MTAWLGIVILLGFSLALNLFMRLEPKAKATVPEALRDWHPVPRTDLAEDLYEERRVVSLTGRAFLGTRWVEQRRLRRRSDQAIVEVLSEVPYRAAPDNHR